MKKIVKLFYVCALIFVYSFDTYANSVINSDQRVKEVTSSLNTIFMCPERVWPGLSKKNFRIIFIQPSLNNAWKWSAEGSTLQKLEESDFRIQNYSQVQYAFIEHEGSRAVVINFDEVISDPRVPFISVDRAVNLAFHEGFHHLFQMNEPWVSYFSAAAERNPNVNYVEALYSRRMLIRTLKDDLEKNRGFGKSKYWYLKWLGYGEEHETRWSDILEGTANFTEIVASVIAESGCNIKETDLINKILSSLNKLLLPEKDDETQKALFENYVSTGYQIEGYEIGLLSLLSKRMNGHLVGQKEYKMGRDYIKEIENTDLPSKRNEIHSELQQALSELKTPAQLLLENVEPIDDPTEDVELLNSIKRASQN